MGGGGRRERRILPAPVARHRGDHQRRIPEHLDNYGTVEALQQAFVDFADRVAVLRAGKFCASSSVRQHLSRIGKATHDLRCRAGGSPRTPAAGLDGPVVVEMLGSTLVITAMAGDRRRKDPSLSSASTTISRPFPSFALDPSAFSFPPTTAVGSRPAWATTVAIREVVVVFPCEPAMATPSFRRISFRQHLRPRDHRDAAVLGRDHLGIVLLHGAGGDHHVHVGRHVLRPVPGADDPASEARRLVISLSLRSDPLTGSRGSAGARRCRSCRFPRSRRNGLDLLVAEHCAPLQVTYCECTRSRSTIINS